MAKQQDPNPWQDTYSDYLRESYSVCFRFFFFFWWLKYEGSRKNVPRTICDCPFFPLLLNKVSQIRAEPVGLKKVLITACWSLFQLGQWGFIQKHSFLSPIDRKPCLWLAAQALLSAGRAAAPELGRKTIFKPGVCAIKYQMVVRRKG